MRVSVPGFEGFRRKITLRGALAEPNLGTIRLRTIDGVKGRGFSVTRHDASGPAAQRFSEVWAELRKPEPNHAAIVRTLQAAVIEDARSAAVWRWLGDAHRRLGANKKARAAFARSSQEDELYLPPRIALMPLLAVDRKWKDLADAADQVLQLHPSLTAPHYYRALAAHSRQDAETDLRHAQAAAEDPDSPLRAETSHLLGRLLSERGDFTAAATQFWRFLELRPNAPGADAARKHLTEWEAQTPPDAASPVPACAPTLW